MALEWKNKVDGVDICSAADVNNLAAAIKANEQGVSNLGNDKLDKTSVVNDLTTGGVTKALSAEQGKALNTSISELDTRTAVEMTNKIINGDFSNGTTGGDRTNGTIAVVDGVCEYTVTGINSSSSISRKTIYNVIEGHKYYCCSYLLPKYDDTLTRLSLTGVQIVLPNPIANQWNSLSAVITAAFSGTTSFNTNHSTGLYAVGDKIYIDNILCIDLTAAFGAGNEPTAAEMDTLLALFPNSWFDGTITLTQKQILVWTLNLIRKNTNAIVALGGTIV